ncbi:uncharacterized protein N0V89_000946 [Didymosphaeria variabile]|uniref:Uncharacterized protein n=1 Tax=Didymosphaeria variabile TaxID=1932322 RepID=A0A9W8XV99_9PLEO|nr:uncharacterized protein N0V89_000946 [Didymosphaeria variabile]KAJ4360384.1 hypothetical protein N0V89_000946 [Didymosphaeria variabile]
MAFGGCPPLEGLTTTEWQTLTDTPSCTESSTVYSTFSSCLVGTDSNGGTQTSSCMSTVSPIVGCDVTGGATKTLSTTSKAGGCTLAPLIWGEDEGINSGLSKNVSVMTTGIPIPYLEMMPNATSSGGSCPWSPLIIEDDDGDNFNDTIVIPTLFMKNDTSGRSCPWVPLDINDAEGDNPQNGTIEIPTLFMKNDTSGGSCPWVPLDINDAEGDNPQNVTIEIPTLSMKNDTSGASCPLSPLSINDDEGDNFSNSTILIPSLPMKTGTISIPVLTMKTDTISIPVLTMKTGTIAIPVLTMKTDTISIPVLTMKKDTISIPVLTMKHDVTSIGKPVAPTLAHETITEQKIAPTLSQTAHPTPSATSTEALGPRPIQAGGKWEIMIEQKVSDLHWRLFDPAQNEAGRGDDSLPIQCFGRPQKDCFPFDIEFTVDKKDDNPVDFEIMIDLPSGRRLKFNDLQANADLPEDGYPSESYGCKDDSRNVRNGASHRIFWCYFEWLGAGGWDGQSDGPVPKDL